LIGGTIHAYNVSRTLRTEWEPDVRIKRRHSRLRIPETALIVLAICALLSGCRKEIRVNISREDIAKATAASQEGDIAFSRKDFYPALIKYLESIRLNPHNEYVFNRLGIAYSQLKYYEEASNAFLRSIELNPKYPYSYNNLGSVYFALKNLKKAEKYFKKAISLKHDEASFHMNMGSLHLEKKRPDKAMEEWRKGLALDPNVLKNSSISLIGASSSTAERRYFMARLMASSGEVEMAIDGLKQAILEGFDNIEAIRKEPDFDPIRDDKRFVEFMENAALLIKLRSKVGLPE
jgi:tetratricopeptide (TPR) repeat protein